jgi:hypothetical protein
MNERINCFLISLLWKLVPLTGFRCWLLDIHLGTCPHCQKQLATNEDLQEVVRGMNGLKLSDAVIRRAGRQAAVAEDRTPPVLSGRISIILTRVYAVVMTVAIFILLFGFGWYFSRPGSESMAFFSGERNLASNYSASNYSALSLDYVRAKGKLADSLMIFKTEDPQMTIIWVESQN